MRLVSRFLVLSVLAPCLALSGCITISSSSISASTRTQAGNTATASATDWGILLLTVPQGLTGIANQQLASACPSGKFTDVQTELSMRNFVLAQMYMVNAVAICQ
jgi:uncharacterized protein YceK